MWLGPIVPAKSCICWNRVHGRLRFPQFTEPRCTVRVSVPLCLCNSAVGGETWSSAAVGRWNNLPVKSVAGWPNLAWAVWSAEMNTSLQVHLQPHGGQHTPGSLQATRVQSISIYSCLPFPLRWKLWRVMRCRFSVPEAKKKTKRLFKLSSIIAGVRVSLRFYFASYSFMGNRGKESKGNKEAQSEDAKAVARCDNYGLFLMAVISAMFFPVHSEIFNWVRSSTISVI